ncbi:MAG: adenylate/guanylate cyclase domain-containing protein [Deltaproteobacteria bacterium]|nr:adenylate/guanylate cyclase domain-containing protein [Deltaproteobacteria bacterium]
MASDSDHTIKSFTRLWRLIEERTKVGADIAAIDQRIWDLFGDDWAIMLTDLAGFSRQVATFGITHFLQVIYEQQKLLLPIVEAHDGILVKSEADSFLILFKEPARALACAIAMQRACTGINARRANEEHVILCVGIGHGRVLKIGDEDVFGHEVNLASKLGEDIARGTEILLSPAARVAVGEVASIVWEEVAQEYVGEHRYWRASYT